MAKQFQVFPASKLTGDIRVPGDKSISHRALILGAIADGTTFIEGFLFGADNLSTLVALQQLEVKIAVDPIKQTVTVDGVGLYGLRGSLRPLDMGNSGTAMRLLTGLLAGQSFDSILVGDDSLTKRPMLRVAGPLRDMGAEIILSERNTAPIKIKQTGRLMGIDYCLPVASAQVKSAVLLAGLYAGGSTCVIETVPSRDHTERMLETFSYPLQRHSKTLSIQGGGTLKATTLSIPADISSAAFFMVAACIIPDSHIILRDVGVNPTRTGIIHILKEMGADIHLHNERLFGAEPVADIEVNYTPLHGIKINPQYVPLAIDEMPIIMIAAACANGTTEITGAEELRVKETDRILAMSMGLKTLGIAVQTADDGVCIEGGKMRGGVIDSYGDHRVAMSFAIAGLAATDKMLIGDCDNVQTSFPNFIDLVKSLGCEIKAK